MFPKIAAVPLYILTESSQTGVPDHRNPGFLPPYSGHSERRKRFPPAQKKPCEDTASQGLETEKTPSPGTETAFLRATPRNPRLLRICPRFLYRLTDNPTSERRGTVRNFYRLTASASAARRRHSSFRFSTSAFIASSSSAEKPSRSPGFSLFLYIRSVLRTKLMSVATT